MEMIKVDNSYESNNDAGAMPWLRKRCINVESWRYGTILL